MEISLLFPFITAIPDLFEWDETTQFMIQLGVYAYNLFLMYFYFEIMKFVYNVVTRKLRG